MCMMNYKAVSEYNSPCSSCPEYLNSCMNITVLVVVAPNTSIAVCQLLQMVF